MFNQDDEVLLVKRNGQNEWTLPGVDVVDAEDPERSLIEVEGLEEEIGEQMTQVIMEDTGVHTTQMLHVGRYAGTVAVHEVYFAPGSGDLRPRPPGNTRRHLVGQRSTVAGTASCERYPGYG